MKYAKALLFLVCMIQIDVYNMNTNMQIVKEKEENQDPHKQITIQNQYSKNYRTTPSSRSFFSNFNILNIWENSIPLNQNGVFDFESYMSQNSKTWQSHIFNYYHKYAQENNVSVSTPAIWVKQDSTTMECLYKNKPNHECNQKCREYNTNFINAIFALQVEINETQAVLKNTDIMNKFIRENIKSKVERKLQKQNSNTVEILKQNNKGHKATQRKRNEKLQNRPWYEKYPRAACAASFFASFVVFHPTLCINFCVNSASLFFKWLASKKTT